MHLLLIHNNYGAYSGEEAVVDRQITLFQEMGHAVSAYRKTTEGKRNTLFGNASGLLQGFYSPSSVRDIKRLMESNKPDAVIIHNLYPYISPAILKHIKRAGMPIIMTVHNFRLVCPTGLFMRNSEPCELCLKNKNEWSCIRYNCEKSILKSIGYAGRNWYARIMKAYIDNVDHYVCITKFQTQKLTEAGFDKQKMKVIPNFVENTSEPNYIPGKYVAISGRISKEKGIDLILDVAKSLPDIQFVFAGTARPEDQCLLQNASDNCTFKGHMSGESLRDFYQNSRFLLMASRWYEGFPMTILDASMYGKPTIGPAHAGFLEIINDNQTGLHFTPMDAKDLKEKVEYLWNNPELSLEMGVNAYQKLNENYSSTVIKKQWESLLKSL